MTSAPSGIPDTGRAIDVAVLAGGVGAARFLLGLVQEVEPERITAIVNTADDTVMHGLSISPDLDTVVYTLADAIDRDRGWGLTNETWRTMEALERFEAVRPDDSRAGERWFNLGDSDLATHFYRTTRLAEGASLTEVTAEIAAAWGVPVRVVPMTDDTIRTIVTLEGAGEPTSQRGDTRSADDVPFQDYFVRLRHSVPVSAVRFEHPPNSPRPQLTSTARAALETADVIVIAPSNPLVSIGPIRSLPGVNEILSARRSHVVAISPIVGGAALKGPADRMLTELGGEASVVGVAQMYAPIAGTLVVDDVDAEFADAVEATGMRCVVHPSVMSTPQRARSLASAALAAATS